MKSQNVLVELSVSITSSLLNASILLMSHMKTDYYYLVSYLNTTAFKIALLKKVHFFSYFIMRVTKVEFMGVDISSFIHYLLLAEQKHVQDA